MHSKANVPYILLSQSIQRDQTPTAENHPGHMRNRTARRGPRWQPPWGSPHEPPVKHGLAQDLRTHCSVWKILPPDTWLADFLISSGLCSNIY